MVSLPRSPCVEHGIIDRIAICSVSRTETGLPSALTVATIMLTTQAIAFMCLRTRYTRIFSPKSHSVRPKWPSSERHALTGQASERERLPAPPGGPFGWLQAIWTTKNSDIIGKCGLDAYFFLCFLRLQLKIFFPAAIVFLTILLPLNATGGGPERGLYRLSFSNVAPENASRLWVHLLCAIGFIAWVDFLVYLEMVNYILVRQKHMTSTQHRLRASATTVLVSGIPAKWLNMTALKQLFSKYKGGVRTIWINRDY